MRSECCVSAEFPLTVVLHQGSALSPFLSVVVLDVFSENARIYELWELLYADNLGILAETEDELRIRVVKWQEARSQSKCK